MSSDYVELVSAGVGEDENIGYGYGHKFWKGTDHGCY
jgi:hypothetical protein